MMTDNLKYPSERGFCNVFAIAGEAAGHWVNTTCEPNKHIFMSGSVNEENDRQTQACELESSPLQSLRSPQLAPDRAPAESARCNAAWPRTEWSRTDPWTLGPTSANGGTCPYPSVRGNLVSRTTGAMTALVAGCDRWRCPVCGPAQLRRHMAHFREKLGGHADSLVFATLTLRPADAACMTGPERSHALRSVFSNRLLKRLTRRRGGRPLYLAQVDLNAEGQGHHIHALIETTLDPNCVAGEWIDAGGGIDTHVVQIGATADDVARLSGYIVKACRWGQGRLMCSRSIGYNTAEARAERQRYAVAANGGPDNQEFEPVEREHVERVPRDRPRFEPFVSQARVPTVQTVLVPLKGGEYAFRRHFDAETKTLSFTVNAVDRTSGRPRYTVLARPNSKDAGLRFLRRYDVRLRQTRDDS